MLSSSFSFSFLFLFALTGDFAHIKASEVMEHFLCHAESYMSRHRVSRHATTVWGELEGWMGAFDTWQDAVRYARTEAEKQKKAGKKKIPWRAPGLHSPAGTSIATESKGAANMDV